MVLKVTQIEPEGIFCETGSEIFTTGNGSYGSFMCFNALKGFLRAQKRQKPSFCAYKL